MLTLVMPLTGFSVFAAAVGLLANVFQLVVCANVGAAVTVGLSKVVGTPTEDEPARLRVLLCGDAGASLLPLAVRVPRMEREEMDMVLEDGRSRVSTRSRLLRLLGRLLLPADVAP